MAAAAVRLLVVGVSVLHASALLQTRWFEQPVDHFSHNTTTTFSHDTPSWKQRYLMPSHAPSNGAPIFFFCGNEGDIETFANFSGLLRDLAPGFHNATVVYAEHRFYGKSLPFGPHSFDPEHRRFLSVEQALADYAVRAYAPE